MNVNRLREDIDSIDQQIVTLLNQRARIAQKVGQAKATAQKYRPAREAEVLNRICSANDGPLSSEALTGIYREIIANCLALEQPLRISYLGPAGTYSEQAARSRFGTPATLVPCDTLEEAIRTAEIRKADLAVVPVENSTEGTVNHTLDLLLETPLRIVGEMTLPIHHQLLTKATSLSSITTVAAHPQALAQCRDWLHKHLPKAKQLAMDSNAQAAQAAKKEPHMAAIAGRLAAQTYQLPILVSNIEDDSSNTTRFLILGRVPVPATGNDCTSLICSVSNKPGSLGKLLAVLAAGGVNMTKLTSRPSPSGIWDYIFYIDIDGHTEDNPIAAALEQLHEEALFVKVIGSYPKEHAC